jgi:hypothetical protein
MHPDRKDPNGEDCGECEGCKSGPYVSDDTETHCIDCKCFICIPGA